MFKNLFVFALVSIVLIYGCQKSKDANPVASNGAATNNLTNAGGGGYGYAMKGTGNGYSASIPVDSANRMIQSYLYSINYPATDVNLRSLSFDADSMRAYLKNTNIKKVKFMLAHQPAYINSGHFGENAGMNPSALTFVIVGTDNSGGYILNNQSEVYEHLAPCPVYCEGISSDYIQQ